MPWLSKIFMTVRGRLALMYVAAVFVALVIAAAFAYETLELNMIERIDRDLITENHEYRVLLKRQKNGDPHSVLKHQLEIEQFGLREILLVMTTTDGRKTSNFNTNLFPAGSDSARILDPTTDIAESGIERVGRFIQLSEHKAENRLADNNGRFAGEGEEEQAELAQNYPRRLMTLKLDEPVGLVRVLDDPVTKGTRVIGHYRIAMRLDRTQDTLNYMLWSTSFGALAALSLAIVVSYFLAGRALRPIRDITTAARSINRQDLSMRIQHQGSDVELGELTSTFNDMLNRLEKAFREQSQFLSDASHELRTPLTIIRGNLELLASKKAYLSESEIQDSVELILDETKRMSRLIDSLLLLARSGDADFISPERFNLKAFLHDMLRKAEGLGPRRWSVEEVRDLDSDIVADRDRLTQVYLNLLQNAFDHTREQDQIRLGGRKKDNGFSLWVTDTGAGIPAGELDNIFKRFYRTDASRSRSTGGTGLGLAIVEAIVRAHGGDMTVTSLPGSGTTFFIWLPQPPTAARSKTSSQD